MQVLTQRVDKFKVVLLGDQSVGKTALISKFMYDTFDEMYQATIGIDFLSKTLYLEDRTARLQLWDTAGQERFRSLIPSYIRDSTIAIIVFDVTNTTSFDSVAKWVDDVRTERDDSVVMMAIGNKTDLENRVVLTKDAEALAAQLGILYAETSAKKGDNVVQVFRKLAIAASSAAESTQDVTLNSQDNIHRQTVDLAENAVIKAAAPRPCRC